MDAPDRSDAVEQLLSAPFLKPEEAKDLRVFFGTPTADDLDTPGRRARWALMRGALSDPDLLNADAPVMDRAEATLLRGDARAALEMLAAADANKPGIRGVRLKVQALEMLGRESAAFVAALPALELLDKVGGDTEFSADDVVEAVRAAAILTALGTSEANAKLPDHKALMAALKHNREKIDPQHWPTLLAEAELLYEKDNSPETAKVIKQVLAMNPSAAAAWALMGRLSVDSFNGAAAEQVACRLEVLASAADGASGAASSSAAPSAVAGLLRARMMLRMSDPEEATRNIAGALKAYPEHRDLRQTEAAIKACTFDPAGTAALLKELDALATPIAEGGKPRAGGYYEAGRALSEARQYGPAAELLREAMARQPMWPQPAIELGLLYIQSGEDQKALATLEQATTLDPFNVRADNSNKLIKELVGYQRFESEHFIIRCKPGSTDAILAREMLAVMEQNHRIVTAASGPGLAFEPPFKTVIDLMPDHRWFGVRIVGMPAIHTIAASTGPCIAMETPRDGKNHQGTYDWERVLRHEYTHTVGLSKTNNRMPHWFTEAQAVYMEQSPRDYPTVQLLTRALTTSTFFDFSEINVAFVRPKKPSDRQQGYAQGHWMYEYMVERFGREAPLKLMEKYAAGVREEQAYTEVLGTGRVQFMKDFAAWARVQAQGWGMVLKDGEPELAELVGAVRKKAADGAKESGEAQPERAETAEISDAQLAELVEAHPRHPDVLELAVSRAVARNKGEPSAEMVPLLKRYAAARPVDPLPHKLLARLYMARPQPGSDAESGPGNAGPLDAIEHLEYLDAREDRLPTWAAQLSTLYAQKGDTERSQQKAERATRIAPFEARYRELAAGAAVRASDLATARRHIEALVAIEPDRALHKQRLDAVIKRIEASK